MPPGPLPYKIACLCDLRDAEGRVLLLHRTRSPNQGLCSPIGGKLEMDTGESPTQCAQREIMEEAGIEIKAENLKLVHTLHKKKGKKETRIVLYFRATDWSGDLMSREPEKFTKTAWFPLHSLPNNLSPTVRHLDRKSTRLNSSH